MSKTYAFSGTIKSTPEVKDFIRKTIDECMASRAKAIRLCFLMTFKIPLGCAKGELICLYIGGKQYYLCDNIPFAFEDFEGPLTIRPMLTEKEQVAWLKRIPMKEFKMFGKIFKRL